MTRLSIVCIEKLNQCILDSSHVMKREFSTTDCIICVFRSINSTFYCKKGKNFFLDVYLVT